MPASRTVLTDGVLDALAWMANTADVPGTAAWDDMDVDARINWWVRRVGALDTVVVAFPGVFGVVADTLPVQDLLGFSSQSIVLCAVAREHGVDDTAQQVRMLAAVLCDRDLGSHTDRQDVAASSAEDSSSTGFAPAAAVWHLAGVMRAVGDELLKRPRPRRIFDTWGCCPQRVLSPTTSASTAPWCARRSRVVDGSPRGERGPPSEADIAHLHRRTHSFAITRRECWFRHRKRGPNAFTVDDDAL